MTYNLFSGGFPHYQQPQNSGIVWVQGVEGAKAYPVASGGSAILMDSEASVFYLKSTDASGMPMPLRVFDYTERQDPRNSVDLSGYITRKEFEEAIAKIKEEENEQPAI